jgi:hypothetical protein
VGRAAPLLSPRFEIVEPESLPYGGVHHGVAGYVALMRRIDELFELAFEPDRLDALGDSTVALQMHVTFRARATGREVRLPVIQLLQVLRGPHRAQPRVHLRHRRAPRNTPVSSDRTELAWARS